MTMSCLWYLVVASFAFFHKCDGARKVNVYQQMQLVRNSRDLSVISREERADMMGLGKGEALQPVTKVRTAAGTTKVKFQEIYEGIPIAGATVIFEEDDNGGVTGDASGNLVAGVDDDIPNLTPRLSSRDAFTIAALNKHDVPGKAQFDPDKDALLEIYMDESLGENTNARLAYKLSYRVEKQGQLSRPFTIIDANTGEIIKQWEGLSLQRLSGRSSGSNRVSSNYDFQAVGGNNKIGKANYDGNNFPKLKITKNDNGSCSLANNVAMVFNCNNSWSCYEEAEVPFTFDCDKGFSDSINDAYSPMADALFYISATYEMFDSWYDIKDPLKKMTAEDTESSVCRARIHYGSFFENAFWDGHYITFGDGNNTFYPMTSINVVAHEIAHGITEMNSDLIYEGESGGINEAFSDMAGEVVEFYTNNKSDWMVGYDIFKEADKAGRYFDDPKKDGKSIGNYNEYCFGLNVHHSSGLFNRAFYFLSRTEGWNVRKAFTPFVVANVLYWLPDSKFYSAACDVVKAAKDLGLSSENVTHAFRRVGIEPCIDTSFGVLKTIEMSVPAGHEILIEFDVTEEMVGNEQLTITASGRRAPISVRTPSCQFCSRKSSYKDQIEICEIVVGTYTISMVPTEDLIKGFAIITSGWVGILKNGTLSGENDTIDFEFEMPAGIVNAGAQAFIEMRTDYSYPVALIRYGELPNIDSQKFDFVVLPGSNAFVCDVKPGKYFAKVFGLSGPIRGINIGILRIIPGRRVDTPEIGTHPPPATQIPEHSGSGSGNGDDTESGEIAYFDN